MTDPISKNPEPERPWHPLLTGAAAETALAAVDAIAAELAAAPLDLDPAAASGRDLSLAGGQAGLALFFSYLDSARPGEGHDETAMNLLERAIEGTSELPAGAGLYSGFAGVAWVLEHLNGRLFDPDGEDPGDEIAAVLAEHLGRSPWQADYDLISGLVGFGVYALERLPRPGGRECLAATVARLAETAEPQPVGLSWHSAPELIGELQRETYPEGFYNLGVAHGVPGVIGLLGEAAAARLPAAPTAEARRLLAGAVDWVLSQRLPPGGAALFPYSFAPGIEAHPTRLAWCYGDLGIAAALFAAARHAGGLTDPAGPAWEAEALAVARHAAARPAEGSGVVDAGLCHGAAGVAHLFNCLYQASGDDALGAAARAWFGRALALRQPGEGIGGFRAWLPTRADRTGDLGWVSEPGFLTGAAGIGLALLAATTPVAPDWDRVLLTNIPTEIRGARRQEP